MENDGWAGHPEAEMMAAVAETSRQMCPISALVHTSISAYGYEPFKSNFYYKSNIFSL